jgi:hypothetical protein
LPFLDPQKTQTDLVIKKPQFSILSSLNDDSDKSVTLKHDIINYRTRRSF